jgi:hypothetical protein
MRTAVFDALLRLFYRVQATLTMIPMFGMVLADRDAAGATLMAALATDFARWLLRGRRWLPAVLGSALVLGGIALATAAVAGGGAGAAVLPVPVPDYPGAPLLNPRSVFLVAIERAGGAGLVFALAVAMGLAQAGVFLVFAGERSAYVRRAQLVERPDRLGLTTVAAPFALQVFFVLITVGSLHAGVINQRPPSDPAAALASAGWRLMLAIRFLIPCVSTGLVAVLPWYILNVMTMRMALRGAA